MCVCVCFHFILDFFQKQNLKHMDIIFVYIMLILFMIVYSVMIDRQVVH